MPMQKLNTSVMKCLRLECNELPTIQLDSEKTNRAGGHIYTAGQALVCEKDIRYGKEQLEGRFPGLHISVTRNPGWLLREQKKLQPVESQTSQPEIHEEKTVSALPKDGKAPTTREELLKLVRERLDEQGRRK